MVHHQRISKSQSPVNQATSQTESDDLQLTHGDCTSPNHELSQNTTQYPSNSLFMHPIQAKMILGRPNDKYEQEADRVAEDVVDQLHTPTPFSASVPTIQRYEDLDTEALRRKPAITSIQRQGTPTGNEADGGVPGDVEASIQGARGSGHALPDVLRGSMEQALDADLSEIRIHTDPQADQLNRNIQARAFTTGQDIFFRQGEYNPSSRAGQKLILHEATHALQQSWPGLIQHLRTVAGQTLLSKYGGSAIASAGI